MTTGAKKKAKREENSRKTRDISLKKKARSEGKGS
jgi:hypothetical protein